MARASANGRPVLVSLRFLAPSRHLSVGRPAWGWAASSGALERRSQCKPRAATVNLAPPLRRALRPPRAAQNVPIKRGELGQSRDRSYDQPRIMALQNGRQNTLLHGAREQNDRFEHENAQVVESP